MNNKPNPTQTNKTLKQPKLATQKVAPPKRALAATQAPAVKAQSESRLPRSAPAMTAAQFLEELQRSQGRKPALAKVEFQTEELVKGILAVGTGAGTPASATGKGAPRMIRGQSRPLENCAFDLPAGGFLNALGSGHWSGREGFLRH